MTERKWTKGPWVWVKDKDADAMKIVTLAPEFAPKDEFNDDETDHILSSSEWLSVSQANANLIAASPDLYEALEMLAEKFVSDMSDDDVTLVRAALAKARGEK